jgi:hypothetical protein
MSAAIDLGGPGLIDILGTDKNRNLYQKYKEKQGETKFNFDCPPWFLNNVGYTSFFSALF